MLIDINAFPIIRIHYDRAGPKGDESGLLLFETLLEQPESFVLIGVGGTDGTHEHTAEQRKQVALWMKRFREPLHRLVKAMVYVEPRAARRFVARAQAVVFAKAWGFPMIVMATEADALAVADRLLSGEDAAMIVE